MGGSECCGAQNANAYPLAPSNQLNLKLFTSQRSMEVNCNIQKNTYRHLTRINFVGHY